MFFCGSMSRNSEGSTGSGSCFKASQKTGNGLKSHRTRFYSIDIFSSPGANLSAYDMVCLSVICC